MKYCPSCATGLDDNVRECPQCGHVFDYVNQASEISQRPGNVNLGSATNNTEAKMNQPPAYIVPPATNQNVVNNTAGTQSVPKWKRLLPLFITIGVIVTIMQGCIFGLGGSSNTQQTKEKEITTTTTVKTYDVSLYIECDQNLIFSKYDVVVLVDGVRYAKLDHGTKISFAIDLAEGIHTIKFHKDGSESVDGSREINVTGRTIVNCKIHCTSSQVEIQEFETTAIATESTSSTSSTQPVTSIGIPGIVADFSFELQSYWKEDVSSRTDTSRSYKPENEAAFVRMFYSVADDPNNSNFKTLVANKSAYAESIANAIKATKYTVYQQEIKAFGEASGLFSVLDTTVEQDGVSYTTRLYVYDFPSVEKQKLIQFGLIVEKAANYNYLGDFSKMLNTIKKNNGSFGGQTEPSEESSTETSVATTTKATPTPVPTDITKKDDTRFAFKRSAYDYTIYYIIDLKEKKVYYFTSLDTKPTIGTFESGDLKKGIKVTYPYDGGTDVISYFKGNTNKIVVYDQNGFDWYYDACYVSEAEKIINK